MLFLKYKFDGRRLSSKHMCRVGSLEMPTKVQILRVTRIPYGNYGIKSSSFTVCKAATYIGITQSAKLSS